MERIRAERVVGIFRGTTDVSPALEAGISVVELTLDTAGALDAIRGLRASGLTVLAGTVREPGDVDAAYEAGAAACVGPAFVPGVVERCAALGIPAIPGASTPSEIEAAFRAGAALVKLFPASFYGPEYVRAVREPLADVPLLVTGGVRAHNAAAFLRAGAVAVGASLASANDARALVEAVRSA